MKKLRIRAVFFFRIVSNVNFDRNFITFSSRSISYNPSLAAAATYFFSRSLAWRNLRALAE